MGYPMPSHHGNVEKYKHAGRYGLIESLAFPLKPKRVIPDWRQKTVNSLLSREEKDKVIRFYVGRGKCTRWSSVRLRWTSLETKIRFKKTQGGQDAHVLGMSILKLCPVSNSSVYKPTKTL